MISALDPTAEDHSARRLHLLAGILGLLAAVGLTGATPVQAQKSLSCTRDLCRVLRSDGEVLSSCGRGEACGTRHQDGYWEEPAPTSCPPLTEETTREHTDVAACSSRRDGRIVSCCWVGDACHSDPGSSAAMGRRSFAGVNLVPTRPFGGLTARAGVSGSLLLGLTRSEPFSAPLHFKLEDSEIVCARGPTAAIWVLPTPAADWRMCRFEWRSY